ncbi:WecB/TagA/CpsF family glycosyltransferase [Enterococcus casseliflavus]|uniref:WecB/TagA/CpsF family glycosyltransferase n=1 Tax=Enterococcus casseliflavus TaxID=37734 RepID=UPI003D145A87
MKVKLLNIEVDNLSMNEAVSEAEKLILSDNFSYIVTPNIDHVVQLEENELLKKSYENSSLVLTDGKPLIWLSKLKGDPIKEKLSGSDFFPKICELSCKKGYRIFLLGAAEGVADIAKKNLEVKYPGLIITGTYSPPYNFENNQNEIKKIIEIINSSDSQILAVGLGAPKQEIFLYEMLMMNELHINLALAIGATIDFEAHKIKRSPKWISDIGFEWLFRVTQDPKRLFKRYWNDLIRIIPLLIKYR